MPVAMLFDIPNQPIQGRREDDLIEVSRIAEIAFDLAKRAFGAWEFREVERQIKGTGEQ